ncbi:MAG: hypothetical protein K8S98_09040 [Planctomycetes bacterium]|nr:hypothetical protein [Planctomycetota bacterium]
MKFSHSFLALAAFLPLVACSKSGAETKSLADQAKAGMDAAAAKVDSIDFSKLTPEMFKTNAKSAIDDLAKKLGELKDAAGASNLTAKFGPMLDQLVQSKAKFAEHLPDMSSLKQAITDFTAKFQGNGDVMKAIQPLLDKAKALIG